MDEYDDYESDQNRVVQIQNELVILSNRMELKINISKNENKNNTSLIWFNIKESIDKAIMKLDSLII